MMNMRPFQIVLIAVFALLALVGLYVFSTFAGFGNNGPQIGTVTIWGTFPDKAVNAAIDSLKQVHKEYNNVSYKEMPAATFDSDLANALASGQGPDLVIIDQEQLLTEEPKLTLIPFSSIPLATFDKTYLSIDQLFLTQTGTYGIPITVDPLVLYYNRALLSAAAVSTPPSSIGAFEGLSLAISKQSGESQTLSVSTVPFGGYANVNNARAILSTFFLQAGSPITTLTSTGMLSVLANDSQSSGGGSASTASALSFYTEFANPSLTLYSWSQSLPSSRTQFLSGDLAFYPGFASEAQGLKDANPNLDFDMAAMPQAGLVSGRVTYGLAYVFAIPKVSANKSGAYSTAVSLTSSTILPALAEALGQAPAVRSLLTPKADDPYEPVYYPEALNVKGWLSPAPSVVDSVFSAMITNVVSGRLQARDALSNADQSLNAAL